MNCESCKIAPVEETIPVNKGLENGIWDESGNGTNYRLCKSCSHRLQSFALRPLEYFNLVSIHGHSFHLHDDFYDYETGEAYQPEIKVMKVDELKFPKFGEIKNDLYKLVDFSIVQYYTDENVINQLKKFDKKELIGILKHKVKYNRGINYKAYEIAGKVTKTESYNWIKEEWKARRNNELQIFAEPISNSFETEEAFEVITQELESRDDKYLNENITSLLYLQSPKVLKWIEKVQNRIGNVNSQWGQLAASSKFDWDTANSWLESKRPLSLIALDALNFCTTKGKRLNQSLWMQKLNPILLNSPKSELIAKKLKEYELKDSVPRTRNTINRIIENIFETK